MADIEELNPGEVVSALAKAGLDATFRTEMFESLRAAQLRAADPKEFRDAVRWPLIAALLQEARVHQVSLPNVVFEVTPQSRIERALLLSTQARPDHVWEPQTTRLLCMLSENAKAVIIGGAYIGDHALTIAAMLAERGSDGVVHAFEPMEGAYRQLERNIELNALTNVRPRRLGLWAASDCFLAVDGPAALGSSHLVAEDAMGAVPAISIDDYVAAEGIGSVELIMLDTEGGEEAALAGATQLLRRPDAPNIVFEIHRSFVDWSEGLPKTTVVRMLTDLGYEVFAIRDFHDNYSMAGKPIEIIPAATVYLEGPPHGFNMLATRDRKLVERLQLHVVDNVSPKLLLDKDPRLHHPLPPPSS